MAALSRKSMWLGAALAVSIAAAVMAPVDDAPVVSGSAARRPAAGAIPGARAPRGEATPGLAAFNRDLGRDFVVRDIFEAKPPPGAVAPAARPTAPPLPFAYVGRLGGEGDLKVVLAKGNDMFVVSPGERFASDYRLDGADESEVRITYVPLDTAQRLPAGGAK